MPRAAAAVLAAFLVAGCEQRPVAPALVTEAVFSDPTAGVRFAVPDGFSVSGRAVLPRTPVRHPTRVVSYFKRADKGRAEFEVYVADLAPGESVRQHLDKHPIGSDKWAWPAAPAADAVGGVAAERYALSARSLRRDLVAVDRGNGRRVLFVATSTAGDEKTREACRQAVAGARWE